MKKIFTLMLSMAMVGTVSAQNSKSGEIDITIPKGVVVTETSPAILAKKYLPRVSKKTTWVITRDDTDNMGIRTIDCAQYVNDVEVPGCEMILHYRDGKLMFITGMVATRPMTDPILESIPSASYGKGMWMANGKTTSSVAPKYTIRIVDGVAHTAYSSVVGTDMVYYDSKTGEEIERYTLVKHAEKAAEGGTPVEGKGTTFFYGQKDILVTKMADDKYVLHDQVYNIYTVDGGKTTMREFGAKEDDKGEWPLNSFAEITSTTTDFTSNLSANLKSVVLSAYGSSFTDKFDAGSKYAYACVLDANNSVVATSDVKEITSTSDEATIIFSTPYLLALPDKATIDAEQKVAEYKLGIYLSSTNATSGDLIGSKTINYYMDDNKITIDNTCTAMLNLQLNGYQPAIDVHWGLEAVMAYHKEKFGRSSFDNKGTKLIARVNQGSPDNAAASPLATDYTAGYMMFGFGNIDPTNFNAGAYPCVDLETIGHEFNHLVASKLKYQGQSGALDESYADIMGKNVEAYVGLNTPAWEASKILYCYKDHKPMRSFSNPLTGADDPAPAWYKGKNWADTKVGAADNGGVHCNSSVQNHWYYMMCEGGTFEKENGTGSVTVPKVDRSKMEQIVFHALVDYGVQNLTYSMARKNSIKVAQERFPNDNDLVAALNAGWDAAGVPEVDDEPASNTDATAGGGVAPNKSRFAKNVKGDDQKGEDLVLTCEKGITVSVAEGAQAETLTYGIMFVDLTESTETTEVYWLSERATVDGDGTTDSPIKKITVEIPESLESGHEYEVIPVYWCGVDENLPDDQYWDAVDKVLDLVYFPHGYDYPDIYIEGEGTTAVNSVSATKSVAKDGKFVKGNRIVIQQNGKQYNTAGQQMEYSN